MATLEIFCYHDDWVYNQIMEKLDKIGHKHETSMGNINVIFETAEDACVVANAIKEEFPDRVKCTITV